MGRGRKGDQSRIEPRFDEAAPGRGALNARLSEEDRPARPRRAKGGGGGLLSGLFRQRKRADQGETPRRPHRRRRSVLGFFVYWGLIAALWGGIGLAAIIVYHALKLPPIDQLAVPKRPPNIAILASDGSLIANRGETGGSTAALKELPPHLPNAFIAIEDRRFREHFGIDTIGIARAMSRNIIGGRLAEGGSTLTQQLAKNLFLTQERTASRKIQEAILALWLERNYSKDQILELYINRVYFGAGAYGVEAAAQRYFGKSARAVSITEAAVLAGLVQAPSRLAPTRNPRGAAERAELVIGAMARAGFITERQAAVALAQPIEARRQVGAGTANYAADWVADVLGDFVGAIEQDIVVVTTLDPAIQRAAERALVEALNKKGDAADVEQGAVVAMSPAGAVRALVGGRNYGESQFNRAVAARRQPGSAFKPFVYLAALDRGWTPDSRILDAPINIRGWKPENFSREYFGEVPLSHALAMSLNTPVVRLIQEVGPRNVVRTAQALGIASALQSNPSLALGTSEVTPLELTGAYAAFANGGTAVIPHIISEVKTAGGKVLYRRKPMDLGPAIQPAEARQMQAMLRETLTTGTARKAEIPGLQAAGKTGTTQDHKDAWFVGFTSELVATVWVGNDDGEPMKKVTGSGLPAEIWQRLMREAHRAIPVAITPPVRVQSQRAAAPALPPQPTGGDDSAMRFLQQTGPTPHERSALERLIGG